MFSPEPSNSTLTETFQGEHQFAVRERFRQRLIRAVKFVVHPFHLGSRGVALEALCAVTTHGFAEIPDDSALAEHSVGRNPVKQLLLRGLYGEAGIEGMRAVKRVLDPDWKLAPGNLFLP